MQALIDADILAYEIGYAAEWGWEDEDSPPPFDTAAYQLDKRIVQIQAAVGADQPPRLFLSGRGNFREAIAKQKEYKGNRTDKKPYHHKNLRAYMEGVYSAEVVDGMEADDMMAIVQTAEIAAGNKEATIICSRDKDLKMVPGWHYGWEIGRQPSFGPDYVDDPGWLKWDGRKIIGVGSLFFLAQCIMGDPTDNIGGLPRKGPKAAFNLLGRHSTYEAGLAAVREAYREQYGPVGDELLLENGRLLWICREADENGPIMWEVEWKF